MKSQRMINKVGKALYSSVGAISRQNASRRELPQLESSFTATKTFRFQADAAVTDKAINCTHVRELFGYAATTNGMSRMVDSFKVNKVTLRALPALGTLQTVALDWGSGANNARSIRVSDTSMGIEPAYVLTRPPRNTNAGFWHNPADGSDLFTVTLPSSGILELTLSIVFVDGTGQTIGVHDTLIVSNFYISALDSINGSSPGHLIPLGYAMVFNY